MNRSAPHKHQPNKFTGITHTEIIDARGLADAFVAVKSALESKSITETEKRSAQFLLDYLHRISSVYKKTDESGALLSLSLAYKRVNGIGRIYAKAPPGPYWDEKKKSSSAVCVQGMSAVLRPYLIGPIVHDLDISNCHPTLILQTVVSYPTWDEHKETPEALDVEHLSSVVYNRSEVLEHIAEFHGLRTDEEEFLGYRKGLGKNLILRLMYGGSYRKWIVDHKSHVTCTTKSTRILALQQEIRVLRKVILTSREYANVVESETTRLQHDGKVGDAIERSIFSKIAQHLENKVLMAMRDFLQKNNWVVHSLVFDGLTVAHREDVDIPFSKMEMFIKDKTKFDVQIVEKALYNTTPCLNLGHVSIVTTGC